MEAGVLNILKPVIAANTSQYMGHPPLTQRLLGKICLKMHCPPQRFWLLDV